MMYRDWEEAAKLSKHRKAIATLKVVHKNKRRRVDLIKPLHGDGEIVWEGTSIPIRKATTKEIDAQTRWRPYN